MFFKDIIDADTPYLEGYDGRGKNVGGEGERQMSLYNDSKHEVDEDDL